MRRTVLSLTLAMLAMASHPAAALAQAGPPTSASGAPCPACPGGCIAAGAVETYREAAARSSPACHDGCVPLASVKVLRDKPLCVAAEGDGVAAAPKVASGVATAALRAPRANTNHRIILSPTAVGVERGRTVVTGYGAGLWEIQHGLRKHVQIGGLVLLPAGIGGGGATLAVHGEPAPGFHVGAGLAGGGGGVFGDYFDSLRFWMAGGHFSLAYKTDRHVVNLTLIGGYGGYGTSGSGGSTDWSNAGLLMPSLGYRYGFHPKWSAQVEVAVPYPFLENGRTLSAEEFTVLVFYGIRGHGDLLFGDIGFMVPLSHWYYSDGAVAKYFPVGFPYFSLGFAF